MKVHAASLNINSMEELPRLSSGEEIETFRIAQSVTSKGARRMVGQLPHAFVLPVLKICGYLPVESARLRDVIRYCLVRLSRTDNETRFSADISPQIPRSILTL